MSTRSGFRVVLPLLLLLPTACTGNAIQIGKTSTRLTSPAAIAMLDMQLATGVLDVQQHQEPDVTVDAEIWATGTLADSHTGAVREMPFADWIELTATDGTLRLRNHKNDDEHQLRMVVRVPTTPAHAALHVQVGELRGTFTRLREVDAVIETGTQKLRLGEIAGKLNARVGTGQLEVQATQAPQGATSLEVGTGTIDFDLPTDVAGRFDLAVRTGGLDGLSSFGLREVRDVTSATAKGERGTGGQPFVLRAGTGQIRLR
ncbi:MAG: hypothetical protein IPK26_10380 [Planctomycetes bacterium]|nr:hypothetical protein [Planctomycetota bacterium]